MLGRGEFNSFSRLSCSSITSFFLLRRSAALFLVSSERTVGTSLRKEPSGREGLGTGAEFADLLTWLSVSFKIFLSSGLNTCFDKFSLPRERDDPIDFGVGTGGLAATGAWTGDGTTDSLFFAGAGGLFGLSSSSFFRDSRSFANCFCQ